MKTNLRALVVLLLISFSTASSSAEDEMTVAFWNVENLFDTVDDPKVEKDEEFKVKREKEKEPEEEISKEDR